MKHEIVIWQNLIIKDGSRIQTGRNDQSAWTEISFHSIDLDMIMSPQFCRNIDNMKYSFKNVDMYLTRKMLTSEKMIYW
jgi:hypothetical protein